jgi:hypothetical protein
MGVKQLRRLQIGKETVAGTAVPATAVLRLNGMIEDTRETVFPEEQTGYLGGLDRQYTAKLGAALEIEGEATFEQLPYVLNAAIGSATATADGVGTGFVYAYTAPTTAKNTIDTYTLESGDDQEAERIEYGYVGEFGLSGTAGEAWMLTATWGGRQATVNAFTAATATALGDVEELLFGRTKLYIDDSTSTLGATLKSSTLLAAELKWSTGWIPKHTADGELYFTFVEQVGDEITLDITFEHNASGAAEKVAWRAGALRLLRLLIEGSTLTTPGTYSKKTCQIDLAGKWEKFEKIDEIDGNDVVKGTLRVKTNIAAALKAAITVVNQVTALP